MRLVVAGLVSLALGCGTDRLPAQTRWFERFAAERWPELYLAAGSPIIAVGTDVMRRSGTDGTLLWREQITGTIASDVGGDLYVADDSTLRRVSAADGAIVWSTPRIDTSNVRTTRLAVRGDRVVVVQTMVDPTTKTGSCVIDARDAATGADAWQYAQPTGCGVAVAVTDSGEVIVGADGMLLYLDAAGTLIRQPQAEDYLWLTPLADGGFIAGDYQHVVRLNSFGARVWRFVGQNFGHGVTADGDVVLAMYADDVVDINDHRTDNPFAIRVLAGASGEVVQQLDFFAQIVAVSDAVDGQFFVAGIYNEREAWAAAVEVP